VLVVFERFYAMVYIVPEWAQIRHGSWKCSLCSTVLAFHT